jgi:hypothetical protein
VGCILIGKQQCAFIPINKKMDGKRRKVARNALTMVENAKAYPLSSPLLPFAERV